MSNSKKVATATSTLISNTDLKKIIGQIGTDALSLNNTIQSALINCHAYAKEQEDYNMLKLLLNKLWAGKMYRQANLLRDFILLHGPYVIKFDDKSNVWNVNKDKTEDSLAFIPIDNPFYEYKKAAAVKEAMTLVGAIAKLNKFVKDVRTMSPADQALVNGAARSAFEVNRAAA